jgi:hypothetical protein
MKLRHLQTRTLGCTQKPGTLEAPLSSNRNSCHSAYGPRQPNLLEEPMESKPQSSSMVRHPARLQPLNQTRSRQTPRSPRYVIATPRCRQRRGRQPRPNAPTPRPIHTVDDGTLGRMDEPGTPNRASPERIPRPHPEMEKKASPPTASLHHNPQT